jgi:hypothetical protein
MTYQLNGCTAADKMTQLFRSTCWGSMLTARRSGTAIATNAVRKIRRLARSVDLKACHSNRDAPFAYLLVFSPCFWPVTMTF